MKVLEDFFKNLGLEEGKRFLATDGLHYKVYSGRLFTFDEGIRMWVFANLEKHIQLISGEINPVWKPKKGERYHTPVLDDEIMFATYKWYGSNTDELLRERGLVFETKEEAITVANEMLKVAKQG